MITMYLAGYATGVDVSGGGATRDLKYGGYFYGGSTTSYAYVGARLTTNFTPTTPVAGTATTNFKIIGAGSVSTIVSSDKPNDSKKIMFTPETPEVLFEDYGTGTLENGETTVKIDPIFSKNIYVDDKHPLKVFIQLEGDCNGVYVTNKSKNAFTVKELAKGKSNVSFSWHIVGNRADEKETDGKTTNYQLLRFPDAPGPLPMSKIEAKASQKTTIDTEVKDNK
jgi:hypothetical protein